MDQLTIAISAEGVLRGRVAAREVDNDWVTCDPKSVTNVGVPREVLRLPTLLSIRPVMDQLIAAIAAKSVLRGRVAKILGICGAW
jgi:hypothetical protein